LTEDIVVEETVGIEEVHPMAFLLTEDLYVPTAGEIRKGVVVRNRKNEVLVDIGAKSEGVIAASELDGMDEETRAVLVEDAEITVFVVDPEGKKNSIILSYTQALQEQEWITVSEYQENKTLCQCRVLGVNRGGLLVEIGHLRGFLPKSQLQRRRQSAEEINKLVGKTLDVKVIEVDHEQRRIIMSERAAMRELRAAKRQELMETLKPGAICDGTIVHLADFGAFVDIGGMEGLVHVSELSWKRINHPSEVLKAGDEVKVAVLSIDHEKQRLALSIKKLQPDPWSLVAKTYKVGQLVEAKITKITPYGAFARINDDNGLIGLIHISELSDEHVEHPREIVTASEIVAVRVIRINPGKRQIGLSIKQVSSDKYLEADMAAAMLIQAAEAAESAQEEVVETEVVEVEVVEAVIEVVETDADGEVEAVEVIEVEVAVVEEEAVEVVEVEAVVVEEVAAEDAGKSND